MSLDPRIYQELIRAVDTRIEQWMRSQPRTAYGIVQAVDTTNRKCSVYLSGDVTPSPGFTYTRTLPPTVGELVRVVIDPRGDRYVDAAIVGNQVRVPGTVDASLSSTDHPFQIGPSGGANLAMDPNEIIARNNGAEDTLHLNSDSGIVRVNSADTGGGWDIGWFHGVAQHKTSSQSISNATHTVVTGWTSTYADGPLVSWDGTDEIVVAKAGMYLVTLHTSWANNASGIRLVGVDVNDTSATAPAGQWQNRTPVTADTIDDFADMVGVMKLAANDRLCTKVWQSSGGALNLTGCYLAVTYLGKIV